jgi:hypothetical protein
MISESGWDVGGLFACAIAAASVELSAPLQSIITLALPAIAVQGWLLAESYVERHGRRSVGHSFKPAPDPGAKSLVS